MNASSGSRSRALPSHPLSLPQLIHYALPAAVVGFSTLLIDSQLVIFATQTLSIAPVTVGLLLALPRVWDAVTDPVLGYWSDRARTRFGRRRPFIALGSLPMAGAFFMLWAPPAELAGSALVLWTGASLFVFYTGLTLVDMPHAALGAELSRDYHERTRIAGTRRIVIGFGALLSVAAIFAFNQPDIAGDSRTTGRYVGAIGAALIAAACIWSARTCREPDLHDSARPVSPFAAFRDVLRNPHALRLLAVALFQQAGVAALVAILPFYSDHVLGTPELTYAYIGAVILTSFAGAGVALAIARSFDKRILVLVAMSCVTVSLAGLSFAGRGDTLWVFTIASIAGLAGGVLDAIGPSLQADVVDYDELRTAQRKEGAYFASWTLVAKLSRALGLLAVGVALELVGFVQESEQSAAVQHAIARLTGWLPALSFAIATGIFSSYGLTRRVHAEIQGELLLRSSEVARAPSDATAREPV